MSAVHEADGAPAADRVLAIEGTVQGVGFRPYIRRLGGQLGLCGWVRNDRRGVQVRIAGAAATLDVFTARLQAEAPPAARIVLLAWATKETRDAVPAVPAGEFLILESDGAAATRPAAITPDLALCGDCRRELAAPGDRRHGYPFINCTNCGPRYSILEALPYDRPRTTMAAFTMCPSCAREYTTATDRRFHAEPNACPVCGPQLLLTDPTGGAMAGPATAIAGAAEALRAGQIVAVKGVGGFHLLVDATNDEAVTALRRRKHREEKPLAVMFSSIGSLRDEADVSDEEARWLGSPAAPIVLVRRRAGSRLAASVAPGNPYIGALLPPAPLYVLLLAQVGRPVVATSGNLSEEPLCTEDDEARRRLSGIADLFLVHNRTIAHAIDDSVLRPAAGGPVFLRRARGYAPAPLRLPAGAAQVLGDAALLCVGGHLKNTVALATGANVVVSPHIGDLGNPSSLAAFRRTVALLAQLHGARFARVACDAHPDYASTRFAESLGLPIVRVQHHLAHILACLLEHGGGPGRVLGVAWDGTGYGPDGAIWGGEFIVVDRAAGAARRVGHLRPFRLPGGEAAIREPRRSALGLLHTMDVDEPANGGRRFESMAAELGFQSSDRAVLRTLLDRGVQAPVTTSAGRLFDGVAALLGRHERCSFEGQAAMQVEFAATLASGDATPWPMPVIAGSEGRPCQLDWGPLLTGLLRERASHERVVLAARFHATLAAGILAMAKTIGVSDVVLTGGCFQNVRLLSLTTDALRAAGFTVWRHEELPPNDGGIAAGQALGVLWGITDVADGFRAEAGPRF